MRLIKLLAMALALTAGSVSAQQPAAPAVKVAPAAVAPTDATPGVRPLTKEDLDAWLDGFVPYALRKGDLAGAVVVVVKDGQVLTQRGFGYADVAKRSPVDPDRTLFRPGSVSKLVTWTAVMQQVEAGRIDLDADVNQYLDFKLPLKDGKPVTMRQLMTHTAGFEEHAKFTMFDDPQYITSLGDYVKRSPPTRIYTPGTTPSYSNYATALAGYIVERVTKMPFNDYVEQHIFNPLGMAHSSFRMPLPKPLQPMMAKGYRQASGKAQPYELMGPAPAGSLASTGADMGRFMIAHLNDGAGLMKPETAREMHDTPLTIIPPLNRMELGFFETNINGRQVIAHLGDTQLFHTALHLFQNEDVGIYMSFNATGEKGSVGPLRRALFEDFADRYFPGPAPAGAGVDAKTSAEHAKLLTGNWLNSRRAETTPLAIGNLSRQIKISIDDKGELIVPAARNPDGKPIKWVETAPFLWRSIDGHERLAAQLVDGKVVRWSIDGASPFMVFDRAPAWQSTAWILPLLYASLGILSLTLLHWPVSALIRRFYKAPLALRGRALLAYRGVRASAGLVLAVIGGWVLLMSKLRATPAFDPWLWLLQIGGLVALVSGTIFAGWNFWLAMSERRGWFSKLWGALILAAMLAVLYTCWTFGMLAMSVDY